MLKYDECGLMNDSEIEEAKTFGQRRCERWTNSYAVIQTHVLLHSMMAWVVAESETAMRVSCFKRSDVVEKKVFLRRNECLRNDSDQSQRVVDE